jgi:hypothetical protein
MRPRHRPAVLLGVVAQQPRETDLYGILHNPVFGGEEGESCVCNSSPIDTRSTPQICDPDPRTNILTTRPPGTLQTRTRGQVEPLISFRRCDPSSPAFSEHRSPTSASQIRWNKTIFIFDVGLGTGLNQQVAYSRRPCLFSVVERSSMTLIN